MKKLLLATLTTLSIITTSVSADERMTKDSTVEIHKECFMHPVLTGTDIIDKVVKVANNNFFINLNLLL